MNGLGKPFRTKSDPKFRKKTIKINVKFPHVNKKPLARKRIFVLLYLNIGVKNFHAKKTTRFFAPLLVLT